MKKVKKYLNKTLTNFLEKNLNQHLRTSFNSRFVNNSWRSLTFLNNSVAINKFDISWHFPQFGTIFSLENVKNTHGRAMLLVKLQTEPYNFTKSNTPA